MLQMMDSELKSTCCEDHVRDTEYDQQRPWKTGELETPPVGAPAPNKNR